MSLVRASVEPKVAMRRGYGKFSLVVACGGTGVRVVSIEFNNRPLIKGGYSTYPQHSVLIGH